jgi:hypothetical protein
MVKRFLCLSEVIGFTVAVSSCGKAEVETSGRVAAIVI